MPDGRRPTPSDDPAPPSGPGGGHHSAPPGGDHHSAPPGGDAPIAFIDLRAQYRRLKPGIDAAIERTLTDGRFVMGPAVGELEAALAARTGGGHVVACASGTDALLIPLMAAGVGAGDAVFVPGFTFPATTGVAALLGATPVFVDVDERSYLIDPADLAARVSRVAAAGRLRPRAVIAPDMFGQAADHAALARIADEARMMLIADAAQSFGGASGGVPVGALAPVTTTSFYPAKPFGCYGDGGALFMADAALADACRSIREHGRGDGKYDIVRIGLNSRLDTLQAAILLAKLEALDDELVARARVAARYDAALAGVVDLPARLPGRRSTWAQYAIRLDRRDAVAARLRARGIPTAVHYPLSMHQQPAYAAYGEGPGSLPVSERLSRRVLCLPMHADLDAATVARIAGAVRDVIHDIVRETARGGRGAPR